jgi:hypothetical protein
MDYKAHSDRYIRHLLTFPIIWSMIIPLMLFDLFLEIYHQICFRLYGIDMINRAEYIRIDRQKLAYLTFFDKISCTYCGYANGLLPYAARIAAETEKYWCGIKHAKGEQRYTPQHHKDFLEYGDEEAYRKKCKLEKK